MSSVHIETHYHNDGSRWEGSLFTGPFWDTDIDGHSPNAFRPNHDIYSRRYHDNPNWYQKRDYSPDNFNQMDCAFSRARVETLDRPLNASAPVNPYNGIFTRENEIAMSGRGIHTSVHRFQSDDVRRRMPSPPGFSSRQYHAQVPPPSPAHYGYDYAATERVSNYSPHHPVPVTGDNNLLILVKIPESELSSAPHFAPSSSSSSSSSGRGFKHKKNDNVKKSPSTPSPDSGSKQVLITNTYTSLLFKIQNSGKHVDDNIELGSLTLRIPVKRATEILTIERGIDKILSQASNGLEEISIHYLRKKHAAYRGFVIYIKHKSPDNLEVSSQILTQFGQRFQVTGQSD